MNRVVELFGRSAHQPNENWTTIVQEQQCPFLQQRCYKVRKSNPEISIGTCTVRHGRSAEHIIICPTRLTDRRQIFVDCLHLLTCHEPGNELHIVSEVPVPGGSVDYFLVSSRDGRVRDFVGIELQTLDTTGTVWPERQRLLRELGVHRADNGENSEKRFGMNWKMTAKTILVQMHHKVETFEHIGKHLVLIIQDKLLMYMQTEFTFGHLSDPPLLGDSMHFHSYGINLDQDGAYKLSLNARLSTDAAGISTCLGLMAEARIELEQIVRVLENKISSDTLFTPL